MKPIYQKYLFLVTIVFFMLGFLNIIFGWLALICMALPFIILAKDGKKTWCNSYCPRANLFTTLFTNKTLSGKHEPYWLIKGKGKWIMLSYFSLNLFVITLSTIMVSNGNMQPMEVVRFLIAFKLPWEIPQLLSTESFAPWSVHLSFRLYSMMFTTTILGLLLAWIFRARTWCTICPINTLSGMALKK